MDGYLALEAYCPIFPMGVLDIFGGLSLGKVGKSKVEIVESHHLLFLLEKLGFRDLEDRKGRERRTRSR